MGKMNEMQFQLSRRRMLRGIGVSMALPWMESVRVWGDVKSDSKQASQAPTRMGILFSGCGFHTHEWWAKGQGREMKLGKVLDPLKDFREKMGSNIIDVDVSTTATTKRLKLTTNMTKSNSLTHST